jgi:hypothetical protein
MLIGLTQVVVKGQEPAPDQWEGREQLLALGQLSNANRQISVIGRDSREILEF